APPPLARAAPLEDSLCSRGPQALSTARGAPPPLARAAPLEDSLCSRGPQALSTARGAPLSSKRWGPTPSAFGSGLSLARAAPLVFSFPWGPPPPRSAGAHSLRPPRPRSRVGSPDCSRGP